MLPYGNLSSTGSAVIDSVNTLANNATTQAQNAITQTKSGLTALTDANPSQSANTMRGYGTQVADLASQIPAYATKINTLSDEISSSGTSLTDTGNSILSIGTDILNMNRDSDNEYVRTLLELYDQYDPNAKVALAAQDVNNSYDSGEGQLLRDMSRSGVNVSSGRSNILKQQYQIARNTALAAAKTRARDSGLDAQANAFNSLITGGANSILNTAKDYLVSGSNTTANAIGAVSTAAGLLKSAATMFGSASDIENTAANLELGYASKVAAQNNTVASAIQYYSGLLDSQSARELSFLNSDLSRSTTIKVGADNSSGDDDDWMNWNGTGHSQTWNKNNLSEEEYNNIASKG